MALEKLLQSPEAAVTKRQREALLMDVSDVAAALAVGQRTLWRWVAAGTFPPPDISIGAKVRRWKRATVEAWIEHTAANK